MNDTPTPKRRRFQYSLRTLLVAVAVGGVLSGRVGSGLREQWRQQQAAREIEKLGGECWLQGRSLWLPNVLGKYCFQCVLHVNFRGSHITNAGLEHLQGLDQLEVLWLDGTKITDAGLEHLQGLDQLESLHLGGTKVTDAGLKYLTGLSRLTFLDLCGTKVSEEGVSRLKTFLPTCEINCVEIVLDRFRCSSADDLLNLRSYDGALECVTKAIEAASYHPADYRKRAEIYSTMGDKAAAERDLKKAVELERQEPQRLAIIAGIKAMPQLQCRWFPDSLLALLVVAGLGWLAVKERQAQRQRAAEAAILKPGGEVG